MCQGKTLKGKKCKKPEEPFCYLHRPKEDPNEQAHLDHLAPKIQKKIQKTLKNGPSKKDGKGFIYVYNLGPDGYYKIGRTKRSVAKRLKEWGKDVKFVAQYSTDNEKYTEALIHLHLDHVRVYRYRINDEFYISIWKNSREPVEESDRVLMETHKLHGISKNTEWFRIEWEIIEKTIERINGLL
jgi:hypothetical protein